MKTILLADDSKNIREYCRAALEEEGYRVVLARDGKDAVSAFRAQTPDLAILDICMPGVNGLEALERIKQLEPAVPVILFTAYDEDCVRDHRGSLAVACVEKSEDLNELKRAVDGALRAVHAEGSAAAMRLGLPPLASGEGVEEARLGGSGDGNSATDSHHRATTGVTSHGTGVSPV